MAEQTDVDVNGLHEFESRTEDSTNSYGDDTPRIFSSMNAIEIFDEVVVTKITT